ncbi:MAG: RIP metalloprotease RseP [bacterium]
MFTTLISFGFVLGVLIFVHELGHFLTAKMVGIRVERFSLGFPPRMVGKKIGDTDYCISWLPLGGYVKMAGMVDESMDAKITGAPWEFQSKSIWQRIIVISAGSFMNILTAIVIFGAVAYFKGVPEPHGALISEVLAGKPAEGVGLQPGDVITAIDGQSIKDSQQLTKIINASPDIALTIEWTREGQRFSATITPELQPDREIGLIGIGVGTNYQYREAGFFKSIAHGAVFSYSITKLIGAQLKMIVSGKESIKDAFGGPIIIAKMAGESARMGFQSLLEFTAFISLNLGLINILPIPVLDGGHLVFLVIEGIRRRPLSIKTKLTVQKIGMAFLLALMVFIIFNDIRRVF